MENPQAYFTVLRIIDALFTFLVFLNLSKLHKKVPFKQRPLMFNLLFVGIFGWFMYVFLDIFIFSLSGLSFNPNIPAQVVGYNWQYPSLWIGNFLREFSLSGILLETFCFFFVPFAIVYGDKRISKFLTNKIFILIVIIVIGLMLWNDNIGVNVDPVNQVIAIFADVNVFSLMVYIGVTIVYSIAGILFYYVIRNKVEPEDSNPEVKKSLFFLRWGILMTAFAFTFYIIVNLFFPVEMSSNFAFIIITNVVFHTFWTLSPVLIYLGLRSRSTLNPVTGPILKEDLVERE